MRAISLASGVALSVESVAARALSVPLRVPFVIASGRVDATRAAEVEATVSLGGLRATGIGEAACLPPVTREDQADVLDALGALGPFEATMRLDAGAEAIEATSVKLGALGALGPVARAGLETAILDALARMAGVPLWKHLADTATGSDAARPPVSTLETDVTIAIASAGEMAAQAAAWAMRGFRALKVKVGKDVDADAGALLAVARAAPSSRLRVDANAGYRASEAIALARECERLGLAVECWEQPCAADDLEGMAEVTAAVAAPVIADESVKSVADVERIVRGRCARGVNLKLAKSG
ncbi:MAG: enolase C-terminal domain-like protein, partial [Polyangiaceae bacterium]